MIAALLIGRAGSKGFPGKNTFEILGKPLTAYPLLAAQESKYVDEIWVSTDCPQIKGIAKQYGAGLIERPDALCTDGALGEDVFVHGYSWIRDNSDKPIELMILLFCNAPTVTGALIDQGIEALRADPSLDSAVSVSRYNMWSPLRARRVNDKGLLDPFVPFTTFGDPATLNCDRDSQGDVMFADMSVSVVRPRCLENLKDGMLPQKWMGNQILPLIQWGGLDVDYEWQIPQVEFWLKKHQRHTAE